MQFCSFVGAVLGDMKLKSWKIQMMVVGITYFKLVTCILPIYV